MSRIPHLVFSSSHWAQWNTYGMSSGFSSLCESQSFVNTLLSLLSSDTKESGIWYMPTQYDTLWRRLLKPLALGVTWAAKIVPLPTRWPIVRPPIPPATSYPTLTRHLVWFTQRCPTTASQTNLRRLMLWSCSAEGWGHPLRSRAFSELLPFSTFMWSPSWKPKQEGCSGPFPHTCWALIWEEGGATSNLETELEGLGLQ